MARHSSLVGKRVEVSYRAGDVYLSAVGMLAADSGKSIFLEDSYAQEGKTRSYRWEIPYQCLVHVLEVPSIAEPRGALAEPGSCAASAACLPILPGFEKV
jgi:hypothetical protein